MTARLDLPVQVPFLDLRAINLAHRDELVDAFARVLDSGWFVLGQELTAFEQAYAASCGAAHGIGVANGLEALSLVLRAWGIGPGDEVIVPSNTYIATWLAVSHVGATVVPVEPDEDSFNLDPQRLEAAITPRTRAVVPVHLYGRPAAMREILAIAHRHGLRVLEDGAQAHGAQLDGQPIGSPAVSGDAVAWSLYPGKNLGALGDGGIVTTDDAALASRLRDLRNYGSPRKYHHAEIGFNSRLDELQAALLRAKLPHLPAQNAARRSIAASYLAGLADVDGLGGLRLPRPGDDVARGDAHVWHLFVIRHPQRVALAEALALRGVATMVHYPVAPHRQPAYAGSPLGQLELPISERLHREVLSLPMGPTQTPEQTAHVIEAVRASVRALA